MRSPPSSARFALATETRSSCGRWCCGTGTCRELSGFIRTTCSTSTIPCWRIRCAPGESFVVEDVQNTHDPSLQRIRQLGIGAAVAVPLAVQGQVFGALAVCRGVGQPPFQAADVRLMETFGAQAAIALEYGRARDELNRLAVLNERERIARELHEGVIQTLFGAGMDLQALATSIDDPPTSQRLANAVDGVDGVIRDLRNYVFGQRPGILADRHVDRALRELVGGVRPADRDHAGG